MQKHILTLLLALPLAALAAPVELGHALPQLTLKNQHGQEWHIAPDTRTVLFAAGRQASNRMLSVLAAQPKGFLAKRQAVYLAELSKMPGFITRSFALPALREQPFEVGVSLDEPQLADWPRQDDAVTLIRLDGGRVTHFEFLTTEAQVRSALGL